MKSISFLMVRWLLVLSLVLVGIFIAARAVGAGTPGSEPEFNISGLTISPASADTGQTISISATVWESGNVSGSYEGILKINDVIEESKIVLVEPLSSKEILFTVSKNEPGTYSVDLDGLTGSFTVTGESIEESTSDSSFPTIPVVIGVVAAVVILGVFIFYLNRRKAA